MDRESTTLNTIIHLITGLGSGGAERMLTRVATFGNASSSMRHIVISLMDEGSHINSPLLEKAGVEVHCLGMHRGRFSFLALIRLVRILKDKRPDILMTWLYHADLMGTLAAPFAGVKCMIWNVRCSNVDFDRYARSTRWIVAALAKMSGVPWAIGANSRAGIRFHEALGYRPKRWLYLPNGLDLSEWRPDKTDRDAVRAELGLSDNELAIVMVARVDAMKDHSNFISAAEQVSARHSNVRFVLIGRGTEALRMPRALARAVVILGERTDIPRLLRGFDIGMLSSAFGEGFPNVIAEAMATGLPCVVTDVGDMAELVQDTGLVVPPRDPDALAWAIDTLIVEGADALKRRGFESRDRVANNWSIDRSVEVYFNVMQEAIRT